MAAEPARLTRVISLLSVGLIALVVVDRHAWSGTANWQLDQAVPMRLAQQLPFTIPAIGALNSYGDPNPNGMVWVAWVLSPLPSLTAMATALGLALAAAIVAFAVTFSPGPRWPAVLALLAFTPIRDMASFWAQWLWVMFSAISYAGLMAYVRHPRHAWFAVSLSAATAGAMMYLPALVTLFAVVCIWLVLLWQQRWAGWRLWLLIAVAVVVAATVMTWGPFLAVADPSHFASGSSRALWRRAVHGSVAVLALPWHLAQLVAASPGSPIALQAGPHFRDVLDPLRVANWVWFTQCGVAAATALWLAARRRFPVHVAWAVAASMLTVFLQPIVTGIVPARDGRPDQMTPLLPLAIALAFGLPLALPPAARFARAARMLTMALAIVFAGSHAIAGTRLRTGLTDPERGIASRRNMPTVALAAVTSTIASDWRRRGSGAVVAVAYDIPIANRETVAGSLAGYDRWHSWRFKANESVDLELERRHALRNGCGRDCPPPRYIIRQASAPPEPSDDLVGGNPWVRVWWQARQNASK